MKKIIGALAIAAIVGTGVYSASAATSKTERTTMRAQLTDAQKKILEQIKTLRDAGKDVEADALAKANGLDRGFKHRPKPTDAQLKAMTAIKSAIEANDYSAFTTAIKAIISRFLLFLNTRNYCNIVKHENSKDQKRCDCVHCGYSISHLLPFSDSQFKTS